MEIKDARDALIAQQVEEALAPYRDLVSTSVLEVMREELFVALHDHPVAQRLVKQVAPIGVVHESGDVPTGDATDATQVAGTPPRRGGAS